MYGAEHKVHLRLRIKHAFGRSEAIWRVAKLYAVIYYYASSGAGKGALLRHARAFPIVIGNKLAIAIHNIVMIGKAQPVKAPLYSLCNNVLPRDGRIERHGRMYVRVKHGLATSYL